MKKVSQKGTVYCRSNFPESSEVYKDYIKTELFAKRKFIAQRHFTVGFNVI